MKQEILPVPEVPDKIVEAVNHGTLAVFIGAGVSRLIGCMGWDQLARNLVDRCFSTKKKDDSTLINFKEKETLIQSKDHKKSITICYYLLKKNGFEDIFYEELKNSLTADKELLKSQNIYDELYRLRGLFITTNADEYFDSKFVPTRIVYRENDFNPSNIDRTKLYHIHGSIKDKDSLIFTVPQYIKRYNNQTFRAFLEKIFREYTVLFVGYGMAEFELLDFLITKFDIKKEKKELKHFILLPFYRGEENILEFERYYYNSMGIEVLPYEKDEKGYGQLYEVIEEWNREINQVSTYLYDTYKEIEDAANHYTKSKAERIFQIIKNDEPQRNHFFKCLTSSSNPFPWLKPLKEKGYFNSANNPKPQEVPNQRGYFTIPHWNILGYLENVAKKNKETTSDEITNLLLEIIQEIIDYRDENGERIENYRTDWVIIKIIFSLPIEKINNKHIEFIKTALNSRWDNSLVSSEIKETVLPKLLSKGEKAKGLILEVLKIILDYKKIETASVLGEEGSFDYTSIMDVYWLYEALKAHKSQIAKICGIEAAKIGIDKMRKIVNEDKTQFNFIWIPTIEDHPQRSFPDKYENQLVYLVRDMLEFTEPKELKEYIEELLKEEHPIFKRIAIHIINYHYKELNDLFWRWEENPLEEKQLKHELYELFKNNCLYFSKKQINKVLQWIETKNYYIPEEIKDNKDQVEKRLAYRKKEWLSTLLDTKDPDALASYEKYNKINPAELDHPGFDFWMETKLGYESPVTENELINKSNEEIAEYLINFKGITGWMDIEGLSDTFRKCVSENPEKFTNNINPFLDVPRTYQHALLWGFNEAWRSKKQLNWRVVFDFISKLLTQHDFWNEEYKGDNYRNWIISQIAELIENGTKDDNHAFNPELLPEAEKILLILVEKTKSDLLDMNDLVTSVLNSTKGKIFLAMISYSLRYARLYKRENEERWIKSIKEDFTMRLNRKIEPSLEFSVILGEYLASLYWLDKKWVISNINRIFPKENDIHWKAAFTGYLFYSSVVYKDLYFLLRKNKHYAKAIKADFSDFHITERLVQHICIGYLEDWEKLIDKESLISQLIENRNIEQLSAIVSFFWMLRDKLTDKIKIKVKPLWKTLYELAKQNIENPEYQKLISDLSKWLSLIDEIDDEIFEWLKLSAKYVDRDFNTPFFIEYLLKHAPKTPAKVGKIYLEMLSANIYPDYKKEDIQQIVCVLYEKNQKEIANRICNLYGAKGLDFLKDIFETHRR
ncbi:SIR2 family protein [Thermatribacter velox]|uniref:SIR2 family protein n=1 Tax=Thermatribacter velox TaxID=3039681 RepID=A0ABZ2Y7W5_9BACT